MTNNSFIAICRNAVITFMPTQVDMAEFSLEIPIYTPICNKVFMTLPFNSNNNRGPLPLHLVHYSQETPPFTSEIGHKDNVVGRVSFSNAV